MILSSLCVFGMGAKIEKRINPTREINTDAPEIRSICIYTVSKKYSCYEMVTLRDQNWNTLQASLERIASDFEDPDNGVNVITSFHPR